MERWGISGLGVGIVQENEIVHARLKNFYKKPGDHGR
jgi:hypothetical protein